MYILLGLLAGVIGLACRWLATSLSDPGASSSQLKVVPINDDAGMFLEVTNAGTRHEFAARLELLSGSDKVQHGRAVVNYENYAAYWQRSQGPRATLGRGDKDRIVIGRVESGPPDLPPSTVLRMSFWDEFNKQRDEYASTGWLDDEPQIDPARLELRLTISATTPGPVTTYRNTFVVNGGDPKALRDEKIFTINYTGPTVRHF